MNNINGNTKRLERVAPEMQTLILALMPTVRRSKLTRTWSMIKDGELRRSDIC